MRERVLEPDFSPLVLAETGVITKPAEDRDPAIRDLRGLLWASIDNDDSRDLDQLSVAEPAGRGAGAILVAVPRLGAGEGGGPPVGHPPQTDTLPAYKPAAGLHLLP